MSRNERPVSVEEENHNQYMIGLAIKQAEKQLLEGTAPPSVLVHYLRQAGQMGQLERERVSVANELNRKKADAIDAETESKRAAEEAVAAMREYYR